MAIQDHRLNPANLKHPFLHPCLNPQPRSDCKLQTQPDTDPPQAHHFLRIPSLFSPSSVAEAVPYYHVLGGRMMKTKGLGVAGSWETFWLCGLSLFLSTPSTLHLHPQGVTKALSQYSVPMTQFQTHRYLQMLTGEEYSPDILLGRKVKSEIASHSICQDTAAISLRCASRPSGHLRTLQDCFSSLEATPFTLRSKRAAHWTK